MKEAVCGSAERPLAIGPAKVECYVLEDGIRVLTQATFLEALGRHRKANTRREDSGLPPVLQGQAIRPFIPERAFEIAGTVTFRLPTGGRASGYNAELLPLVCEAYLAAREAGKLPYNQLHVAQQAEVLIRALAKVGIIALVDEATGYQEVRERNALARILEEYVASELQPWVPTFPDDFYREMFRLRGHGRPESLSRRPSYFGNLTNDIVYERLAPGVLDELKRSTPRSSAGRRIRKFHQGLTPDKGHPKLREHLSSVVTIMKLSDSWDDFTTKLDHIHPKF
ncbi:MULTISPECIES: P63C domain-containing protein [unclassified Luteococcus]|uniref:P63C domain-containing protein n=1 Tax=unclassified Luteococcus TaxID=2639923 RepID=UPI00313CAD55